MNVFTYHLVEVTTNRDTVKALCGDNSLVMEVTGTEAVAATIGATCYADIMAVADACLVVQILPVGIDVVALVQ